LGPQWDGSPASAKESTSGRPYLFSKHPGASQDEEGRDYYKYHEVRHNNNSASRITYIYIYGFEPCYVTHLVHIRQKLMMLCL
jgi:hypothetical protein